MLGRWIKWARYKRSAVMTEKEIGEQSLQLLQVAYELATNDPAGVVYVHQAGQRMGLGTVQYQKDREQFTQWADELEEAGYIERQGKGIVFFHEDQSGLNEPEELRSGEEGYGLFSVTEEGRREVEEGQ